MSRWYALSITTSSVFTSAMSNTRIADGKHIYHRLYISFSKNAPLRGDERGKRVK
jgi:hypothetical protein